MKLNKKAEVRDSKSLNDVVIKGIPKQRRRHNYNPSTDPLLAIFKTVACLTIIILLLFVKPRISINLTEPKPKELTILLWNDVGYLAGKDYDQCGCLITTKRHDPQTPIDAVVINAEHPYTLLGLDLLNYKPKHLVVFAARQPLSFSLNPLTAWGDSIFNFTMSYRLDSDLIWTEYYFSLLTQTQKRVQNFLEPDLNYIEKLPSRVKFNLQNLLKSKNLLVTYKMYEVNDDTMQQSLYLEELRKHIELAAIDSCQESLCSLYKFMLIFENSSCPDYVNPQLYMALTYYMVPVLIGGGNLSQLVPPNCYINSKDFSSPKHLAEHLSNLSANPQLYEQFFWWHTKYQLHRINMPYCALCRQLRQPRIKQQPGKFVNWWHQYKCPNQTKPVL